MISMIAAIESLSNLINFRIESKPVKEDDHVVKDRSTSELKNDDFDSLKLTNATESWFSFNKLIFQPSMRDCDYGLRSKLHMKIQSLNLSDCKIDDLACQHVAEVILENGVLEELNLSSNLIGSEGLQIISASLGKRKLISLLMADNRFGRGGCRALSAVIVKTPTLKSLDISKNNLGMFQIAPVIRAIFGHQSLQTLNLSENRFGDSGCKKLGILFGSDFWVTSTS
jgi:hypothetical protein